MWLSCSDLYHSPPCTCKWCAIVTPDFTWDSMSAEYSVYPWYNDTNWCWVYQVYLRKSWVCIYDDRYSPVGNGPQKSIWTVCQGSGGNGDIWRGSGWSPELLAWQAMHLPNFYFTLSSILGNQIFSQSNLLCLHQTLMAFSAIDIALSQRALGIKMWLPRNIIFN